MKTVLALVLCFFMSTLAFANGSNQNHTCQGGHNCTNNTTGSTTNNNTNTNTNNNTATSTAVSSSSSTAVAAQQQSQQQSQTAEGGSASASASNGGQSMSYVNNQPRQAPPASAPDVFPTAPCQAAYSGGASAPIGGISLGGVKTNKDCNLMELSRHFAALGNNYAAAKALCATKAAHEAKLTTENCLVWTKIDTKAEAAPSPVVIPVTPITVNVPPQQPVHDPTTTTELATCTKVDNVCKAALDGVVLFSKQNPTASYVIRGDSDKRSSDIMDYLVKSGISDNNIWILSTTMKSNVVSIEAQK